MGRLQSLVVAALGRSPYEDELIDTSEGELATTQNYDDHGRPTNPETKRRQREQTRAANEVMQATGVVEESSVTKAKERAVKELEEKETLTGLRLLEFGRVALVGGVWGVLGLRRRILFSFLEVLKYERTLSPSSFMFAGLTTVMAYHVVDWTGFICQVMTEGTLDEGRETRSPGKKSLEKWLQTSITWFSCYLTVHLRMFAVLQQLNMISSDRLLPSFKSFIPFSAESPLEMAPLSTLTPMTLVPWATPLLRSVAPMAIIYAHAKVKFWVARFVNAFLYAALPHPKKVGSDQRQSSRSFWSSEPESTSQRNRRPRAADEQTLRALEGRPQSSRLTSQPQQADFDPDTSDDEEPELAHATLISFDVEATDVMENMMESTGSWSAELRSANEPEPSSRVAYRITTLTMLPAFLGAEGLSEIVAGIILLPLEAMMVRFIGRAYRGSAGLGVSDLYEVIDKNPGFDKLFSAFAIQLVLAGSIWTGTTLAARWLKPQPITDKD
ncbi:hypothetical protein BP5796_07604 [Coleophoma crateriformis]|uniref:Uncharacterized protein n=1 Tax=Coleophoma crateriformis TaxID=565419 RepID=A0A3D8RJE3_9HELO|nr:hypothetical protein BP5796_07604 [Coleophoma crateriformis]